MPDTVHLPLLGNVSKGSAFAGGIAAVAVGGYLVYKHEKTKTAAATTTATTATQANSYGYGYGYGSGYGYGAYGYGSGGYGGGLYSTNPYSEMYAGGEYYGYGAYGYGLYSANGEYLGPAQGTGTSTESGSATSNAQWAQEAITALEQAGVAASTATGAISAYLTGGQMTSQQQQLVTEAEALVGPAPNPPAVSSSVPSGQSSTTPAGSTSTAKTAAGPISNLQEKSSTSTSVSIGWNPATGATQGYAWKLTGPVNKSGNTSGTSVSITGLKKGEYNFGIQGLPGGPGNNIHVSIS